MIPARSAREEWLIQTLLEAEPFIREAAQHTGYGLTRPDNPNDFSPDSENTPEEIEAHKAACEAYDKGEYIDNHPNGWLTPTLHVIHAPWGPGVYTLTDPKGKELLEIIAKLRKERE